MLQKKQKAKKIASVILAGFVILTLSGCTFRGSDDGGVYKSINEGMSFEQKGFISEDENLFRSNIASIALDPQDSNVIYAGTEKNGLFRSFDAGETWVRNETSFGAVSSIVINPENPDEIYITTRFENRGKIMKTVDGGTEWTEPFTQSVGGIENWRLAMDPNNSSILYAGDSRGGIYKTTDSGKTWETLLWAQSGIRRITIDNVDTSRVYFGTTSSGALRTDDGGENFVEILDSGIVYNIVAHPYLAGVVYAIDNDGLWKSTDSGGNFEPINTLVKPEELRSRVLAIDPSDDQKLYLVTGSAFHKTTDGGATWKPIDLRLSRVIAALVIDPKNTKIIYLGAAEKVGSGVSWIVPEGGRRGKLN